MITDRRIKERIRNHGKPMPTPADLAEILGSPPPLMYLDKQAMERLRIIWAEAFGIEHHLNESRLDALENGHLDPGPMQESADSFHRALEDHLERTGTTIGPIIPLPPIPRYTDLMIDMEGLSNTPDSAPAEIALVFFDRDHATREFCSYRYTPSPISAIRLGFTVNADTLKWWDDQGMTINVQHGEPLPDVLLDIAADIARHAAKGVRVWSRGNTYDLAILKLAYARTGQPLPWDFWNERDVRTWLEGCRFKSPRKNDHDALQDACNQALDVIEATTAIPA